MKKNEWNDFINEQLDMKCKLINEISTELLNLENLNYDFVTSGKIEEESVKLKIDDELRYRVVGDDFCYIGYGSYCLDYVFDWKKQYFEVVPHETKQRK